MKILYIILFIVIALLILSRFINIEIYYNTTDVVDDEKEKKISIKLKRILDKNSALKAYFKNNSNLKSVYYDLYPDEKESEKLLIKNEEVSR